MVQSEFVDVNKLVDVGANLQRSIQDIVLSRYACYLIAMNGDPRKEVIALAQTYFAVKTHKQEQLELQKEDSLCLQALCQMLGYSPYESSLAPIIVMVGAILFAQK